MAIGGIGSFPSSQTSVFSCEWLTTLYKTVHDLAMRYLQALKDFLCCNRAQVTWSPQVGRPLNILAFYRGEERDSHGRTRAEIGNWDNDRLESTHNYIQWLFPLDTASGADPTAPILDQATIQAFRRDPHLRMNLLLSLTRMLDFYGLTPGPNGSIVRSAQFSARSGVWLTPGNHNFLRITRMIRSLNLLGLPEHSKALFRVMLDISRNEGRGMISADTIHHWQQACPPL